jgi:rod shape determining protein RodA
MIIGILFIYSSGVSSTGIVFSNEYIRQIIWASTGLVILLGIAFLDYERLRFLAVYIYFFFIALLIITFLFGKEVHGARSWLGLFSFGIQPSEFAKVATILLLSTYYANGREGAGTLVRFLSGLGMVVLPVLLILIQPDLGTALVYIPIFLFISFIAGAKLEHIVFVLLIGCFFIFFTLVPYWNTHTGGEESKIFAFLGNVRILRVALLMFAGIGGLSIAGRFVFKKDYFFWIAFFSSVFFLSILLSLAARLVLKDYQIMRLIVFVDPDIDPRGAGWNIIQSVTAVGSGGLVGKGFLSGTQSHYQFLPQQSTDFIFSIIAEEWGFLGGIVVFLLFGIIFMRGIMLISNLKDNFARYLVTGIVGMIFFHFLVNIGMAMGIMPITGIPLFFLSYGGSSLWTAAIGIGIMLSIQMNKYRT